MVVEAMPGDVLRQARRRGACGGACLRPRAPTGERGGKPLVAPHAEVLRVDDAPELRHTGLRIEGKDGDMRQEGEQHGCEG